MGIKLKMFSWPWKRKRIVAKPRPAAEVIIKRGPSTDQGTFGTLYGPNGFTCKIIELPDRGNKTNISRIPAGRYKVVPYNSKRFRKVYHLQDVEGRTYILTHSGNLAGDVSKGFRTHSHGCILLGKYFGVLNGQRAVMCSRNVLRSFSNLMGERPFTLEIREAA
jgi:hypothetical protein